METSNHIDSLLDKLEEVRAVFVLSKRSIPFLEEFFGFVRDVAPLVEEIDKAIRESGGEMPQAKSQLESVSQATELATTEILDLVDAVLGDLGGIEGRMQQAAERAAALEAADGRLMARLREGLGASENGASEQGDPDHASLLADVEAIHAEKQALRAEAASEAGAGAGGDALAAVRQNMNRIMLSLQVQDITAQQIASVNHLIESVRTRLMDLIRRFTTGAAADAAPRTPEAAGSLAFDPDARYNHTPDRQRMADELISGFSAGALSSGSGDGHAADEAPGAPAEHAPAQDASPAQNASPDKDAAEDASPAKDASAGDAAEPAVSQDDVDQLFAGGSGNEAASQDDIDALFR